MKRNLLIAAMCLPIMAVAQNQTNVLSDTIEYGKVLNYSPMPGQQIARQVCTTPTTGTASGAINNPVAAVVGGGVGALVGSRFGSGHGKDALTIAGAIGGAIAGNSIGAGSAPMQQPQCSVVYEPGPPTGYQVAYEYQGKHLTAITRMPPGQTLRVRSRVTVED